MIPQFFLPAFALAGVIAALGPLIIHLLNRRRYRVVEWAAMDFLRQALQRSRKVLQLRDLLLLLLRTVCVLLFGLALARPYFASSTSAAASSGPVHAVLVVDNSLSMGYQRLDGTLLEEAIRKAEEFLGRLPTGSWVSVLPLCGAETAFSFDAYRTLDDARDALKRIKVVDRAGSAAQAIDLAREACRRVTDLPAKRVVFLSDQQVGNWPAGSLAEQLQDLPELQLVRIGADVAENAWIADFRVQDGIADVETTTTFYATVRYEGANPQTNVQVSLEIDGSPVATRTVDLEPGQTREVEFPFRFDIPAEPGKPAFIKAAVALGEESLSGDRVRGDNRRWLMVPVVAALPVVFVDQFGEKENPQRNDIGETFRLRRLLAPITSRAETARQLVQIRHVTIDKLDRSLLEDARLVVIAGVPAPEGAVTLLREYVLQGGQLFLAAGARFDPKAWAGAWQTGAGILPAPLKESPYGQTPEEASGALTPFQLAFDSLGSEFRLEGVPEEELKDLYQRPVFFKAVVADASQTVRDELAKEETARITADREFLAAADARREEWAEKEARGLLSQEEQQQRTADDLRRSEIDPAWLLWRNVRSAAQEPIADVVERTQPRVLGEFERDKMPFLIERQIGAGRVLLCTTGLYSEWSDITRTNAALVFDRLLRNMLERTLPPRNFEAVEQLTFPIAAEERRAELSLVRPDGTQESLAAEAVGAENFGVSVRGILDSGTYTVTARRAPQDEGPQEEEKLWDLTFAVNAPERESELRPLDAAGLKQRLGNANYRWLERDEPISLAGARIHGQNLWWWCLLLLLVLSLGEIAFLAWPIVREQTLAAQPVEGQRAA